MPGLNEVRLMGYLGQDPELRHTQSGQPVLSIRMATTEIYYDQGTKEKKERTEWHSVVCWGKLGEALNSILVKGSLVLVSGRLQTRSWEDKTGGKRYSTEINAGNVQVLPSGAQGNAEKPASSGRRGRAPEEPKDTDIDFDSIPF